MKKEVQTRLAELKEAADEKDRRLFDRSDASFKDVASMDDELLELLRANTITRER